jgi:hypothetical protein
MIKKMIGPFHIVGVDDPVISSATNVTISMHDDQENTIKVGVKPDLLHVISQQLTAAAKQAKSQSSDANSHLPVVIEACKAAAVHEPGQGLFLIFEVNDGLAYVFPLQPQLATLLRDELSFALSSPEQARTVN